MLGWPRAHPARQGGHASIGHEASSYQATPATRPNRPVGPHIAGQATSHSWGSKETSEPHRTSLILALTTEENSYRGLREGLVVGVCFDQGDNFVCCIRSGHLVCSENCP